MVLNHNMLTLETSAGMRSGPKCDPFRMAHLSAKTAPMRRQSSHADGFHMLPSPFPLVTMHTPRSLEHR